MRKIYLLPLGLLACGEQPKSAPQGDMRLTAAADTTRPDTLQSQEFVFGNDTVRVSVGLSHEVSVDTVFSPDTIIVPAPTPPQTGVDTIVKGDTTKYAYWHVGKIVDSVKVVVKPPTTTGTARFGPSGLKAGSEITGVAPFSYSIEGSKNPKYTWDHLRWAKANNVKVKVNVPGGGHDNYMKLQCPRTKPNCIQADKVMAFSYEMWRDTLAKYDNTASRDSIKKYRAQIGIWDVMDEPHVHGADDGSGQIIGNTWGPAGWLKRLNVDSLCKEARRVTGGMVPISVSHAWHIFDTTHTYKECDDIHSQYSDRFRVVGFNSLDNWIKLGLDHAKKNGTDMSFSINWINGGIQDRDGTWDCKDQGGVKGQRQPNCEVTNAQLQNWSPKLARATCAGLTYWRWDDQTTPRRNLASKAVAESLKTINYRECRIRPH